MELLPCPFCGKPSNMNADDGIAWVNCPSCQAEGPTADDADEAKMLWNDRL